MRKVYLLIIVILATTFVGYLISYMPNNVIYKVSTSDVNNDGDFDNILLYYDDEEVLLKINDAISVITKVDNRNQVFAMDLNDHYDFELNINGSSIVVGLTYSYTNKYGSTSWLQSYTYDSDGIKKVWDSDELLKREIHIDHYEKGEKTLYVNVNNELKEIILDDVSGKAYIKYTTFLLDNDSELVADFRINPEYRILRSSTIENNNLIIRTVTTFGSSPISDSYISIYELTNEGVVEIDNFFSSFDEERATELFDF